MGAAFDQLSSDNNEHADGIGVVTTSVKELNEVTQRNIEVAEQSAQVAGELLQHAATMTHALQALMSGGEVRLEALPSAVAVPEAPVMAQSKPASLQPCRPWSISDDSMARAPDRGLAFLSGVVGHHRLCEVVVMVLLSWLVPAVTGWQAALLDASLLTCLAAPLAVVRSHTVFDGTRSGRRWTER